jgi:hypothetical protein
MPSVQGKSGLEIGVVFGAVLLCGMAVAQLQEPGPLPATPGQNAGRVPFGQGQGQGQDQDPIVRRAQLEAAKRQNADRQKKMIADTDKIVQLAEELKAKVDSGNKDTLSVAEAKKIEAIEKLARSVKDRMRMQ